MMMMVCNWNWHKIKFLYRHSFNHTYSILFLPFLLQSNINVLLMAFHHKTTLSTRAKRGDMWTDVVFLTNFSFIVYFIFLTAHFDMFWINARQTIICRISRETKMLEEIYGLCSEISTKWFYSFLNESRNWLFCFFFVGRLLILWATLLMEINLPW